MFPAKQLKAKIVSEDGTLTFSAGKPATGQLILSVPGKLSLKRMEMKLQGDSIVLEENIIIPRSGKYVYDFAFEKPLHPGGNSPFDSFNGVANLKLYPDFRRAKMNEDLAKRSFKASHGNHHTIEAGYYITTEHTRYHMQEDRFMLKRRKIWPLVLMAACCFAIVFLVGLAWYFYLPVLLFLFSCERRMTHNTYFAGLANRVFMDDEGKAFWEVRPKNGVAKFLDASIRVQIEELRMTSIVLKRKLLLDEWGTIADNVHRLSDKYLIALPVPKSGYPVDKGIHNGEGIVWSLTLRYPRSLLPDLIYKLEIKPEYRVAE